MDRTVLQAGLVSSHFFFRFLHVLHPVLERPFVCFATADGGGFGYLRGLPRGFLATTLLDACSLSSTAGSDVFSASWPSSSNSSIFGVMSSVGLRFNPRILKLKVVTVLGDSLEAAAESGEELVLSLPTTLSGAGLHATLDAIRREFDELEGDTVTGKGDRYASNRVLEQLVTAVEGVATGYSSGELSLSDESASPSDADSAGVAPDSVVTQSTALYKLA